MQGKLRNWVAGAMLGTLIGATAVVPAHADEGMWTFDNVPVKLIQQKYGFTVTQQWLDHVRLSCVRLNDGGSGSFISPDGLLLTNHHVARGQLQKSSTPEHDYIKTGFYAKTQADEIKSPDLEIDVLQSMEDVTAAVQDAARGLRAGDALKARREAIARLEADSKARTGLTSQVVTLYHGGEYWLYRYKRYTDVRIVFAPEAQTAFFGGDPDNFTYPRYDLDMAVFRVYDNGKPLATPNYLKWNAKGAAAHELVFVAGHPGSTEREDTMSDFQLQARTVNPLVLDLLQHRIAAREAYGAQGPEQAREVASDIFGLQNSLKVYQGRVVALADPAIIAKKQGEEDDFRKKVNADPALRAQYGAAWDEVAAVNAQLAPVIRQGVFRSTDSTLAGYADTLVGYADQIGKPDAQRLNGFHDAQLPSLRLRLGSPAPVYKPLEEALMTSALQEDLQMLGPDDPWVKAVLSGRTPADVAHAYISGTKLDDPAYRKSLLDGGAAAINASSDPLLELSRRTQPITRDTRRQRDALSAPLVKANEELGKARFAVYGKSSYPDATFTLRLSYGAVEGYPMNGTIAPPMTTMFGLYDRSDSFSDASPFDLPQRWVDGRSQLNLATPMDFVSSNDIIGGNSGSPVINKNGEIVGLIFDGNIESLAGDFVYDGTRNRAVSVHTAAMTEALRKLYGAGALMDEIQTAGR